MPARIFIKVDLPAPFSPISACISPWRTSSCTSRRACTPGKPFEICDMRKIGGSACFVLLMHGSLFTYCKKFCVRMIFLQKKSSVHKTFYNTLLPALVAVKVVLSDQRHGDLDICLGQLLTGDNLFAEIDCGGCQMIRGLSSSSSEDAFLL